VNVGVLLGLYARKHPERLAAVRELPESRAAAKTIAAVAAQYPKRAWLRGWVWLDLMGDPSAAAARGALTADPITLERFRFDWALEPDSAEETAESWLAATACGDTDMAAKIAARAVNEKLLTGFFKE
jgi:hypothetical protein